MKIKKFLFILLCFSYLSADAAEADIRLVTHEYPPYVVQKDGKAAGLSIDIAKEAFSRMGKTVSIEFVPLARMLVMVTTGEADGLLQIKKTPERELTMLFPKKTLFSQDYVFFVRKGAAIKFNGDFASIESAKIGVANATSYGTRFDDAAKAGRFKALDPANTNEQTFKKLLAGRFDMAICSRLVGLDILKSLNALDQVEISGPPTETTGSYLVLTRKKDLTEIANKFDQIIEGMEKDGTMKKLNSIYGF